MSRPEFQQSLARLDAETDQWLMQNSPSLFGDLFSGRPADPMNMQPVPDPGNPAPTNPSPGGPGKGAKKMDCPWTKDKVKNHCDERCGQRGKCCVKWDISYDREEGTCMPFWRCGDCPPLAVMPTTQRA